MLMLLALAAVAGANEAHDWVIRDPSTIRCAANEFFDTIELVCVPCSMAGDANKGGANLVGDARHVDQYGNALSCRCPVGFEETVAECSEDCTAGTFQALQCKACPVTSLSDSSDCTKGVLSLIHI